MNDDTPPTNDKFSDPQLIVIYLIQIFSATLSVIGSTTIVFKIIRDWRKNGHTTPYDRIIFGLSACDVFASITFAIDQFLYPRGSAPWAFGTPATCQFSGVLSQTWPFWANWYNLLLSWYFLLTLLSQLRRKDYIRKSEVWMHLSGIYIPILAIIGLRREWYAADESLVCWVTNPTVKWIVGGLPTLFVYLSMIVNYGAIYVIVRKSVKSNEVTDGSAAAQKLLKREAVTLMVLYVASFSLSASFPFICQFMETYHGYTLTKYGRVYHVMLVFQAIFMPLQGFFNVFIYIKPAYTRFRATNPNKSVFFVLHQALFNPSVPDLHTQSHLPRNSSAADNVPSNLPEDNNLGSSEMLGSRNNFEPSGGLGMFLDSSRNRKESASSDEENSRLSESDSSSSDDD